MRGDHAPAGAPLSAAQTKCGSSPPRRTIRIQRWKDKSALVVDAVARLAEADPPPVTGAPYRDLVAELDNFRHCISEAGALPLAGLMLTDDVEHAVRDAYLARIVAPRRKRLQRILTAAVDAGDLSADADLDVAGSFLTGSWYAFHVAHRPVPTTGPHGWRPRSGRRAGAHHQDPGEWARTAAIPLSTAAIGALSPGS